MKLSSAIAATALTAFTSLGAQAQGLPEAQAACEHLLAQWIKASDYVGKTASENLSCNYERNKSGIRATYRATERGDKSAFIPFATFCELAVREYYETYGFTQNNAPQCQPLTPPRGKGQIGLSAFFEVRKEGAFSLF